MGGGFLSKSLTFRQYSLKMVNVEYDLSMRIESLRLHDVGPFHDSTIEFPKGTNPDLADIYLLVGENGTGKSTVLQTLAQAISPENTTRNFSKRAIAYDSSATVFSSLEEAAITCDHPGDGRQADDTTKLDLVFSKNGSYVVQKPGGVFETFNRIAAAYGSAPIQTAVGWAAFSYGAVASDTDTEVISVKDDKESPYAGCLQFTRTADPQRLAQFVANQKFKHLKAKEAGKGDLAVSYYESVERIEALVADILQSSFKFEQKIDTNDVSVCWNGDSIQFSMLPDGVKSVLGWVGDLLVRLEKIAWVNNISIHSRSFLLLLDEIDIHLHPRWQRQVLVSIQKYFPNAQIIASTHSPYVVASLKDGAVIELKRNAEGEIIVHNWRPDELKLSYPATLSKIFGLNFDFPIEVENAYEKFGKLRDSFLKSPNAELRALLHQSATALEGYGEEMANRIGYEMRQLLRLHPK
jgi:energy-coupling factor transporter ATP-binding protein EcfA2